MINRRQFRIRPRAKAQGLVEYAIILALVALVSIVILGLVGMAANRNFGLICSIFGCKSESLGGKVLAIDRSVTEGSVELLPFCAFYGSMNTTLVYASIYTNLPPANVFVDFETGERLSLQLADPKDLGGYDTRFGGMPDVHRYKAVKNMDGDQLDKCPKAIVVQSPTDGITLVAPMSQRCYSNYDALTNPTGYKCD